MWTGLLAILKCAWDFIVHRNRIAFFITFFYAVFLGCWIVIPRKIAFYYYYYPAGMMLSFALAYLFYSERHKKVLEMDWVKWVFLGASFGLFIYFFPILAGLRIPANSFQNWMWFRSWI
jgi:dolichyl-phosphate-mannose--protein O-mannosyl transferase